MAHSELPELARLSVRGPWIPKFENLSGTCFARQNVPAEDGLLFIPGEDLFYYATGRHPQFPVLMFDHTLDPFSSEEIRRIARARHIRWLIIKKDLQVNGEPVEDRARLLALLREDFRLVQNLGIYDVYRECPAEAQSGNESWIEIVAWEVRIGRKFPRGRGSSYREKITKLLEDLSQPRWQAPS